ncbi:MAG: bifunctional riboflavin kinase/FAD synthetase [Bacteroidota bacterium]
MRVFADLNQLPVFRNAVITIGSFDGVHTGHRYILEKIKSLAKESDGESVVITFDPHPRAVLKPDDHTFKLITTTDEKIELLRQAGIDNVVVAPFTHDFANQTAQEYVEDFLIQRFHPQCIVIGYDHRFGKDRKGGIDFLRTYEAAGKFKIVEILAQQVDEIAVSSSKIRTALDETQIKLANRLLGHPFLFSGIVVQGNQVGRTIGFPTANVEIPDRHKLLLPQGIYAARARVGERSYQAMLYIGDRPSVATDGRLVIEVNLIDFEGDLYGKTLHCEVIDFIRSDQKFDSLEALTAQIGRDKIQILARLEQESAHVPNRTESVAIVILNYNTRKHLETYLPSVVAFSTGARIILADNGSPDDSIDFVKKHFPEIEILDLKQNFGFAEGYNQALARVKAEIYVVLNSDVEVSAGWMEPVLEAMYKNPLIGIAQPKIMAWRDKTIYEYAGAAGGWIDTLGYPFCRGRIFNILETDFGQYDEPQACFWAAGAAFFIRAELYHDFGGFDGDYFAHNEEIDLCWRLKRAGYSVWCIPQSTVYHLGGGTLEYESPRKVFLNFRNSLLTMLKNEGSANLYWKLPARLILDGVAGLRFALKGQYAAIGAILKAHGSFYRQFGATLKKRAMIKQIIRMKQVGPVDETGIYRGSIVFQHYLRRVKRFSALMQREKSA